MPDNTIAIAAASAIVAIIYAGRRFILKIIDIQLKRLEGLDARGRPLRRAEKTYDAFLRRGEFYRQMEAIRELKTIQRVLLFVGSNCGGMPVPSKAYRVKARDGWAEKPHVNPMALYDFDLMVDSHYCVMLADMIRTGFVVNTTETMSDCVLKTYYLKEKVKQSILYFLNIDADNQEMMFLSVASYVSDISKEDRDILDLHVYRMRAALEPTGTHHALSDRAG